ncbi:MAG: hypothetical protein AAFV87_08340 [Pseudomonadota bacterium]
MQRYLYAISTVIAVSIASIASAQDNRLQRPNTAVVGNQGFAAVTGQQKFECKNHVCTCTIGDDCEEMFDTISVANCDYGAPGELECESKPKD